VCVAIRQVSDSELTFGQPESGHSDRVLAVAKLRRSSARHSCELQQMEVHVPLDN
jgi:hypothetical protein